MALRWDWNERVGWLVVENNKGDEETYNLYEGNSFLLMIKETERGWAMWSFWADKDHAKNCLGLSKGCSNIYLEDWNCGYIKQFIFNKKKSRNYKEIIPLLVRAFDEIEIKIVSEE